jgi:hypothetical protein
MMEGINSTMIYGRDFGKCHNIPQVNKKKGKEEHF